MNSEQIRTEWPIPNRVHTGNLHDDFTCGRMDYSAKVQEFVNDATTGATRMLLSMEKRVGSPLQCLVSRACSLFYKRSGLTFTVALVLV